MMMSLMVLMIILRIPALALPASTILLLLLLLLIAMVSVCRVLLRVPLMRVIRVSSIRCVRRRGAKLLWRRRIVVGWMALWRMPHGRKLAGRTTNEVLPPNDPSSANEERRIKGKTITRLGLLGCPVRQTWTLPSSAKENEHLACLVWAYDL